MWNAGLDEAQAGIKIAGRNINYLRYADDTTLMAESEEEVKGLLMKAKEESERMHMDSKLNIQKTKIMASGSITSWQIDFVSMGKQWKQWQTLFPWAPKSSQMVTVPMKLKDTWKKSSDHLDSILKSRDITLFPVVMYRCENWTIKKAECQRIDAFELWCWRRLLRVPWTARRSNQSILKEISPEHSLERLLLKLQYCGHLMWRTYSLEKTPMMGLFRRQKGKGVPEDKMVR